jgi:amino acid adenylation domain-containing protein
MNRFSILELLSESFNRFRQRIAIEWKGTRISYDELETRANEIATRLISSGADKESLVAVRLENSLHVIPTMIGIWKAGCIFVPLDQNNPERRLTAMLSLVKPAWVVSESQFLDLLDRVYPPGQKKFRLIQLSEGKLEPGSDAGAGPNTSMTRNAPAFAPDDLCYLYFTSGSTGSPKAIAGRYKSIAHFVEWEIETFKVDETCRVAQFTHPAFDAFLRDVLVPLCVGGTVCIPDGRETILLTSSLIEWIDEHRISVIHCVPSLFRMILNQELRPEYFRSLRYVMLAGERLFPADVKRWMDVYGERVQLVNFYGPTETTMIKFFHLITRADAERKSIPIGKPMTGARAIVVGADGKSCPPGAVGEIYIRTPYRSLGYYHAPELTAQVFVPNPFSTDPHDIVYKTGDLGRVQTDGDFEFLGRKDHQIKIRGLRVELGEIESSLRSCTGVNDAVVIEATDSNGEPYLCAYVVTDEGLEPETLRDHLLLELPANLVPSVFVKLDAMPLTLNGKIDRRALPAPEKRRSRKAVYVAPRTLTEEMLVNIWTDLLGVDPIGVDDDFFELGGHSLLATQLMSRLRVDFQVELPLGALFENPTIAKLSVPIAQSHLANTNADDVSRMLDELEQLTDEKAKSILSQQLQHPA